MVLTRWSDGPTHSPLEPGKNPLYVSPTEHHACAMHSCHRTLPQLFPPPALVQVVSLLNDAAAEVEGAKKAHRTMSYRTMRHPDMAARGACAWLVIMQDANCIMARVCIQYLVPRARCTSPIGHHARPGAHWAWGWAWGWACLARGFC